MASFMMLFCSRLASEVIAKGHGDALGVLPVSVTIRGQ